MTAERLAEQIVDAFQQEENYILERLEALALERVITAHLQPLYAVVEAARAFDEINTREDDEDWFAWNKRVVATEVKLHEALAALQAKETDGGS